MKGFHFKLAPVLKHRLHRRDLCRHLLAQLLADDRRFEEQKAEVEREHGQILDEIKASGQAGPVNIEAAAQRRFYSSRLRLRIAELAQQKQLLADQVRFCRNALIRAEKDVKAIEQLEAKQKVEFLYEQQKREQLEAEDLWMAGRIQEASS